MTSQDQHDVFPLSAFVEMCFSFCHVCRQVTAYGGELRYTVSFEPYQRSRVIDGRPDVVLQGNNIFLEHFSRTKLLPRLPQTVTVTFREVCFTVHLKPEGLRWCVYSHSCVCCQAEWRRTDGQPCTREHLLMALADVAVFMIRATYADSMVETR